MCESSNLWNTKTKMVEFHGQSLRRSKPSFCSNLSSLVETVIKYVVLFIAVNALTRSRRSGTTASRRNVENSSGSFLDIDDIFLLHCFHWRLGSGLDLRKMSFRVELLGDINPIQHLQIACRWSQSSESRMAVLLSISLLHRRNLAQITLGNVVLRFRISPLVGSP